MSSPIYDQLVAEHGSDPLAAPCACDTAPDECATHPEERFASAADFPPAAPTRRAEPLTLDEAIEHIAGHLGTTTEDIASSMWGAIDTALGRVEPEADHG